MQAHCPHCSNVFNTERAGIQFCPSCGQQINVPDPAGGAGAGAGMPPPPPGSPGASLVSRGPVPWEEREKRGVLSAFIENTKEIALRPGEFWQRMRPDGPLGDAIFYGWICYAITGVLSIPFAMVMQGVNRAQLEEMMQNMKDVPPEVQRLLEPIMQMATGTGTILSVLAGIVIFPVGLIIGAAIYHLFCLITGAAKNGFNATLRVLAYSRVTYLVAWVPICGGVVALFWGWVLLAWGIYRAQDTTVGRAVVATVVIPVVLGCCCIGGAIALVAGMAGAAAGNMQ